MPSRDKEEPRRAAVLIDAAGEPGLSAAGLAVHSAVADASAAESAAACIRCLLVEQRAGLGVEDHVRWPTPLRGVEVRSARRGIGMEWPRILASEPERWSPTTTGLHAVDPAPVHVQRARPVRRHVASDSAGERLTRHHDGLVRGL